MAHELDTTNGITSFASARKDAWHRLGQTLPDVMTATEALEAAHLTGWDVRKAPIFMHGEPTITDDGVTPGEVLEVPDRWATVRTNPVSGTTDYLGVVGAHYTPIQNEDHADLLDALVGESGAHYETAGALRGGRETFMTMKMPQHLDVNGDRTDYYVAALNSHDGSSAFRLLVTPVRIVCANTQAWAISRAKSSFSIRHTSNAREAIVEARHALGLVDEYLARFEEMVQELADSPFSDAEAVALFHKLAGDEDPQLSTRTKNTRASHFDGMNAVLRQSITIDDAMRGTKFGAWNAVTEYVDHFMPVRGKQDATAAAEARALRTITSSDATALKTRAVDLLMV